jgi:hypothetical protein
MSIELLFGILMLVFIAAWGLWLFVISRHSKPAIIGGAGLLLVLATALVIVNGERIDNQRQEYRSKIEVFIERVSEAQEVEHRAQGSYSNRLPELDEELLRYEGGLLQEERDLSPRLAADGDEYTVSGQIASEAFTLEVERRGGETVETRTCSASAEAGCVDGAWSPT